MNLYVMSLFTNVLIKEALEVIGRRLREGVKLAGCTELAPEDIMDLLEFVLSTTYFMFDGKIYQQIHGTPMGNPVSVWVSNLYMEDHEDRSIQSTPPEMKPKIWKRYVDDSFEIVKKNQRDHAQPTLIALGIQTTYNSPMNQKLTTPSPSSMQKLHRKKTSHSK